MTNWYDHTEPRPENTPGWRRTISGYTLPYKDIFYAVMHKGDLWTTDDISLPSAPEPKLPILYGVAAKFVKQNSGWYVIWDLITTADAASITGFVKPTKELALESFEDLLREAGNASSD